MDNLQLGPAGGIGGKPFEHYEIPEGARLTAVHIFSEWVVNALQFDYAGADGKPITRPPIGGLGGEHHVFYLDEDEYLTGISGRAGWYVDSIRFHTNKRVSPLYGGAGGDADYSFDVPKGYEVYGFFGRSAWYIDAVGLHARPHAEPDEDYEESWLSLAGEGEAMPARVVVRREVIQSSEDLDALEDSALAEALAEMGDEAPAEGTADAAVYTQVIDDEESGETVAVVLAVVAETGGVETVGDEPNEVAVMVTDAIENDEDMATLEEEAVDGAIDTLLDELGGDAEEVEVTIYSGVSEDKEDGLLYGAVVAVATKVQAAAATTRAGGAKAATQSLSKGLEVVEGIGPKIAELLSEHGIRDLAELAAVPVDQLREILGGAGKRFRLADPTTWPEQARLGAAGAWDALTELQARLKAGR